MRWTGDALELLDQRHLPHRAEWLRLTTHAEVAEAIREMAVRGAPAIGIAAAYGLALAARRGENLAEVGAELRATRPTAVNLARAVDRVVARGTDNPDEVLSEAMAIEQEDLAMNRAIGEHGATWIKNGFRVLTICNTGAVATAGHGTALGVIRSARDQGKQIFVYSCETRPRLQGLRLTAWELAQEGIPFQSIVDSAAAMLMAQGKVDLVIAGADRIARNGDTANKIGTYMLAVCARHHGIPFLIAAPSSTFDPAMPDGTHIPIEERAADEILRVEREAIAPADTPVYNPGFDVTPGHLIDAIVSEQGVHAPPYVFAAHR
jgi:methylthioribose-1-phosphate isomerase